MNPLVNHLIIVPVVLPLVVAATLLVLDDRRRGLKAMISVGSAVAMLGVAVAILRLVDAEPGAMGAAGGSYRLGGWPASFGIVIVVDRLSAMMLTLTALIAAPMLAFGTVRWQRAGPRFHATAQFLLVGLNGAFLTGDLFNLFVFFEVLLAASYGLVLHGLGEARVREGLHYIAINLVGSSLLLVGIALIYGVTGTLNMADVALRIGALSGEDLVFARAGGAILGTGFLVKAGAWPLGFWLPTTYEAASAPVAAIFAMMTKVGVYALLRLNLVVFGLDTAAAPWAADRWILIVGIATIVFGAIGALSSQTLSRLTSYCAIVSSGTLIAVIGCADFEALGGALFYLAGSTLGIAALFLLIELIERGRDPGSDDFNLTMEIYGDDEEPDTERDLVGVAFPGMLATLGLLFIGCALTLAGLPPFPGFIAKLAILDALLEPLGTSAAAGAEEPISALAVVMIVTLLASGLALLIAMTRAGINAIWVSAEEEAPTVNPVELAAVAFILLACFGMTVRGGPLLRYAQDAAASLGAPAEYIEHVFPGRTAGGDLIEGELIAGEVP